MGSEVASKNRGLKIEPHRNPDKVVCATNTYLR